MKLYIASVATGFPGLMCTATPAITFQIISTTTFQTSTKNNKTFRYIVIESRVLTMMVSMDEADNNLMRLNCKHVEKSIRIEQYHIHRKVG